VKTIKNPFFDPPPSKLWGVGRSEAGPDPPPLRPWVLGSNFFENKIEKMIFWGKLL